MDFFKRLRSKPAIAGWISLAVLIWKALGEFDTLKSVVQNISAVWTFLSTTWGMLILLLVGLGLLFYAEFRRGSKTPSPALGQNTTGAGKKAGNGYNEESLAEQMGNEIQKDRGDLAACVKVYSREVDWHHLGDIDSYFIVAFDVFSSSVFQIDIGKRIEGHLRYEGQEFERTPEVRRPLTNLQRSREARIELRQWVSQSMMNRIALDGGKEVTLNFSALNIWVDANSSDVSQIHSCRLSVPNEYRIQVATQKDVT